MAVPKRRTTSSKRNMRRANHDKVTAPNIDHPAPQLLGADGLAPRVPRMRPLQGQARGQGAVRRRRSLRSARRSLRSTRRTGSAAAG
ncbi:MAG: 50S ribosomal protein L32 [Polyangiaceae bacterium]